MADTFKFPNGGYDVTICRKQDILDCIDKNIIDFDDCNFTPEDKKSLIKFLRSLDDVKDVPFSFLWYLGSFH